MNKAKAYKVPFVLLQQGTIRVKAESKEEAVVLVESLPAETLDKHSRVKMMTGYIDKISILAGIRDADVEEVKDKQPL